MISSNPGSRSVLRWACLGAGLLISLGGCVHLEKFSGQATEFNIQVADAQNKTLLLNVVRAAYRFPMHFTELSTLSGTGTLTEGGTLTLPFATFRNPTGGALSAAPTVSVTQTPTFNVAVLETQEFYQGMLKPISPDEMANYLEEGLQPELVFTLTFGALTYQESSGSPPAVIENNFHRIKCANLRSCPPGQPMPTTRSPVCPNPPPEAASGTLPVAGKDYPNEYFCFRAVLRALVDRNLSVESTHETANIGPLLGQASFTDLKWLSGLDPKTYKMTTVDSAACDKKSDACPEGLDGLPAEQKVLLTHGQTLYRVQKDSNGYRFCFNEAPTPAPTTRVPFTDLPDRIAHAHIPDELICHNRIPEGYKPAKNTKKQSKAAGRYAVSLSDGPTDADSFDLQAQPRSTEGVVYYLGEIARCDLDLDRLSVCSVPSIRVAYRGGAPTEDTLFAVTKAPASRPPLTESDAGAIAVNWDSQRYSVLMDPQAQDRSGQVLRIVTQLLALNRAAKDFPAPAVVPIISR